jgi:hypothetical protein
MRGPRRKPRFDSASFGLIFAVYWLWRRSIVCCRIARLAIVVRHYRVARIEPNCRDAETPRRYVFILTGLTGAGRGVEPLTGGGDYRVVSCLSFLTRLSCRILSYPTVYPRLDSVVIVYGMAFLVLS